MIWPPRSPDMNPIEHLGHHREANNANFYKNLENKEEYLNVFNEEAKTASLQNFGDEYLYKEISDEGTEDLRFSTPNYSSTSEDLQDTRNDNNVTEHSSKFEKPEDYQHNYSTDLSYDNYPPNDNRMHDSFQQSENDSDCSKQDSELENQSVDAYYPTLIKKSLNNKHEHFSDSETHKATNSVSELKANTENDSSHTRKDSLMIKNNKSYIRFDDSENGRFYSNAENQTPPQISSHSVPSSTEFYTSSDNEYMYNYQPTPPREVESPLHEESDQDENLKKLDNQQLSNYHKKDRHEPADDLEEDDLIPLKQAEGTRKITILKQKMTHTVSKEEQGSINIHQNPQHRSPSDERIASESLIGNNDSPKHEKIEKREETIVFVKGTHIPGKNYGPEDDTFGYYFDTYENQQPNSELVKQFQTNIKGGPSSESSHRIQHNNHGDGYSTQYFSNSQPISSGLIHANKNQINKEYSSPSSRKINQVDPPTTAHEGEITYDFPRNQGKQLADTNSQHSYNENNGPAIENLADRNHHGENQHVSLSDIDPDQMYIDENTGQLIKFVTEEEARKLGIKAEYLTNEQIKEYSPTNFEKHSGQDQDYSKPHGSNNLYKQKDERKPNTKHTHSSSAGQSFHSPVTKQRGGNTYQKQAIIANNNQYHFPSKHVSARYNTDSLPFKETHVVYEDEPNNANPSHSNIGSIGDNYVLCPKHSSDSIQNQEGNKLNFESPGYSVSNQKSSYNQNNNNNKGSGGYN
ncbi:uncharacterized protein CEXT_237111 [Caerostris extrusa]|uniref:GATA zinc finger domain-containing protein 14-like n=1 Tax=Caerostris extrusa TaxID=172846 RepID=A0AAV4U0Z8_CAEEX|nr:uncharacterized protein CEXT_237111 [Caerostris extrusa]